MGKQELEALRASSRDLGGSGLLGAEDDDADEDEEAMDAELRQALDASQREQRGRPAGAEEVDFTRALEATRRALGDVPQEEADQEQADALLATMLQNQMLKQQLQQDRGFTAMLGSEGDGARGRGAAPRAPAPAPSAGASWGEMLGLWGSGEPDDAAAARGPAGGAGRAAASTYQEGQGLFGALAATGSWIGESLGLIESEQPAAGTASPAGAARGDEAVLGGDSLARRRPSRPADKKDD